MKLGASGCSFFDRDAVMPLGSILYRRQSRKTHFLSPQPVFLEQVIGPLSGDQALSGTYLGSEKKVCTFALKMIHTLNMIFFKKSSFKIIYIIIMNVTT